MSSKSNVLAVVMDVSGWVSLHGNTERHLDVSCGFVEVPDERKEETTCSYSNHIVAQEHKLDFVEQILVKVILDNPVEARSFLMPILKG